MNLHADTLSVRAEVDRRFELAGVDPHARTHHEWHRHEVPARPLGAHPLAALVARLLDHEGDAQGRAPMAARRPRHP